MSFKISKNYLNTDWINLNMINENSFNWDKAIEIIEDRFNTRFLDHVDKIKTDDFSGFLVMSIDCLLIETLMQFYLGANDSETNYKGFQWKAFRDFLKNSSHFKQDFKSNEICKIFYQHFRCGLLHQSQTKGKSLIKFKQMDLLRPIHKNKACLGLIIDRGQFHDRLILEFRDYIRRLKENEQNFKGDSLRANAIIKMNMIVNNSDN